MNIISRTYFECDGPDGPLVATVSHDADGIAIVDLLAGVDNNHFIATVFYDVEAGFWVIKTNDDVRVNHGPDRPGI